MSFAGKKINHDMRENTKQLQGLIQNLKLFKEKHEPDKDRGSKKEVKVIKEKLDMFENRQLYLSLAGLFKYV